MKSEESQNGKECIELVDKYYRSKQCKCKGIRIIFMDIEMPIMDGFKATKKLIKMMNTNVIPRIPIVALTAFLDEK